MPTSSAMIRALHARTSLLRPGPGTSGSDLDLLRYAIAGHLLTAGLDDVADIVGAQDDSGDGNGDGDEPAEDPADVSYFDTAAIRTALAEIDLDDRLVVMRHDESDLLGGVSSLIHDGWAPSRRIGPFLDDLDRPIWFGLYRPAAAVSVFVPGRSRPALVLTAARRPTLAPIVERIDLEPGTVWVLAQMLTPGCPDDGYVGFAVQDGTVTLPGSPGGTDDRVTVWQAGPIGLDLTLSTMRVPTDPRCDPGEVVGPATLQLTLGAGTTVTGVDGRCTIGTTPLTMGPAVGIRFDASWQRLCFEATATPDQFELDVDANVADLVGSVTVAAASWSVPITRPADPAHLGDADAASSGWLLELTGLPTAEWVGAPGRKELASLGALISAQRMLARATIGPGAPVNLRHDFTMWRLASGHSLPLSVTVTAPCEITLMCDAALGHVVSITGQSELTLDRPIVATGTPFPTITSPVRVLFSELQGVRRVAVVGRDPSSALDDERFPLALENGFFRVSSPLLAYASGNLDGSTDIRDGSLSTVFGVRALLPTLPDPYLTNVGPHAEFGHDRPGTQLSAVIAWGADGAATLQFRGELSPTGIYRLDRSAPASRPAGQQRDEPFRHGPAGERDRELRGARERWDSDHGSRVERARAADTVNDDRLWATAGDHGLSFVDGVRLVDVSTRQHLVGVQLVDHGRWPVPPRRLVAESMALTTPLDGVQVLMLPQVQWEPVVTLPKDQDLATLGYFPTPLASADDGGPTLIAARSKRLAPVIPDLTLCAVVDAFATGERAAFVSTLAFGIKILCTLRPGTDGVRLNDADYDGAVRLTNALQLSVEAQSGQAVPGAESPSFEGLSIQLRNGVDRASGTPLGTSVLGWPNTPDEAVEEMFNNEFASAARRVPITRLDLSGYGASTFSDWSNPFAAFAEASKVQFRILVGRTALEIVKFNSVLYPWGIRVTRMVTIERRPTGGVVRRDSGWQPESDGLFDFRYKDAVTQSVKPSPYVVHPGIVRGISGVRNIRPAPGGTPATFTLKSGAAAKVHPYHFDADVFLESGRGEALARTAGMLGYLHVLPVGEPLAPVDLAALVEQYGAVGGPVDVDVVVGASGLRMRALRVEVDAAAAAVPEFVAAVRGAPALGRNGAWSVVRQANGGPAAGSTDTVIDGAPLIRQGGIQYLPATPGTGGRVLRPVAPGPYRFADGADVFATAAPANDYGFLQTTPTHAFLYRRPHVAADETRIVSTLPPLFADVYARSTAASLFPPATAVIELRDRPYVLAINPTTGRFRLDPPVSLPSPRPDLPIGNGAEQTMRLVYSDSHLTLSIEETTWAVDLRGIVMWTGFPDLPELIGTRSRLTGSSSGRAVIDEVDTLIADWVDTMLSFAPGMSPRARPPAMDLTASNLKLAGKASAKFFVEREVGPIDFKAFGKLSLGASSSEAPGPDDFFVGLVLGFEAQGNIPLGGIFFLVLGLEFEVGGKVYLSGAKAGKGKASIEIKVFAGVGFGTTYPAVKLYGFIAGGLAIERDSSGWHYGGLGLLEAEANLIEIIKVTISGEFVGIGKHEGGRTINEYTGELSVNVKICFFFSIELTWEFGWEQEL